MTTTPFDSAWLKSSDPTFVDAVRAAGRWRKYKNGEMIYGLGAEDRAIWGVSQGAVRMHVAIGEHPSRLAHISGPGYWFGELELLTHLPRVLEVEASSETHTFCLEPRDIDRLSGLHSGTWRALGRLAAFNTALAVSAADDLLIKDPRLRLAAVLLRFSAHRSSPQGCTPVDEIPVTQPEIADAANLSRSVAAALLAEFVREGFVETKYRRIRIIKPDRMLRMLE